MSTSPIQNTVNAVKYQHVSTEKISRSTSVESKALFTSDDDLPTIYIRSDTHSPTLSNSVIKNQNKRNPHPSFLQLINGKKAYNYLLKTFTKYLSVDIVGAYDRLAGHLDS